MSVIYLDNAATSHPKAPGVAEAMVRCLHEQAGNPGRAGHRLAVEAERVVEQTRELAARALGVRDPRRVALTSSATDALNAAIHGVVGAARRRTGRPVHVVTTAIEHNAVTRPLRALADRGDAALSWVGCDERGWVDPAAIGAALRPGSELVVLSHASNVLGAVQDVAAVGRQTRAAGALLLLDASQTAGLLPLDPEAWGVDLLAAPGHKALLGPPGTGLLYVGPRCVASAEGATGDDRLRPWREGGAMGSSAEPRQPAALPAMLEAGTPNTVGLAGLGAAIEHVLARPVDAALDAERRFCDALATELGRDGRFTLYGREAAGAGDALPRVGVLALNIQGLDPADAAAALDSGFGIAVRSGLHCAPGVHRAIGTFPNGTVRISPGAASGRETLDRLLAALDAIAG